MKKVAMTIIIICFMLIAALGNTAFADSLEVTCSLNGMEVNINVKTSEKSGDVTLIILNPGKGISHVAQAQVDSNGNANFKYLLDPFQAGQYTIKAGINDITGQTTFTFGGNSECSFLSFSINGVPGNISGDEIIAEFPEETNTSAMAASFRVATSYTKVYVGSTEQFSGQTANDFRNPVVFRVVAQDGSEREYTVRVKVKSPEKGTKTGGGGGSSGGYHNVVEVPAPTVPPAVPEPSTPDNTGSFKDIGDTSWAKESIEKLAQMNIVSGVGNDRFEPNRPVAREEFVKMIVEAFHIHTDGASAGFADVGENDWFYPYVAAAREKNIINGFDANNFGVGAEITRQDMVSIIYRAARTLNIEMPAVNEQIVFTDGEKIADYAKDAVTALQRAGIVNGYETGAFGPDGNATRAESAKIIYGLLQLP